MKKLISLILAAVLALGMTAAIAEGDLDYVKGKGVLVVGITDFAPMDYLENGEWIGFDADMAKAFPWAWKLNLLRSTGTTSSWSWTTSPSTASGTA